MTMLRDMCAQKLFGRKSCWCARRPVTVRFVVSHVACTSVEGAENYFATHLRSGDYFAADEPGHWHGSHAADLLGQAITAESFRHQFLELETRQRQSDIKYQEFTYTAPKGFSVAAAVDPRLKAELLSAVKDEFTWFEGFARVRDRRGTLVSTETTRATGNLRVALFAHETSRTNDPNFHVHGLVANVTFDAERKADFALHYGEVMRMRKTLDARIHNNLARRCGGLGYSVEVAANGFALREVSREATELFCSRSRQVATAKELLRLGYSVPQLQAAASRLGNVRGSAYLDAGRLRAALGNLAPKNRSNRPKHALDAEAVLLTRPSKEQITAATLREDVAARLVAAGLTVVVPPSPAPSTVPSPSLVDRVLSAFGLGHEPEPRALSPDEQRSVDEREALLGKVFEQASEKVFATESVVRLDTFVAEAVRLAPGELTNEEMTAAIRASARLFIAREASGLAPGEPGHEMVTTHAIIAEERALLAAVGAGLGNVHPPLVRSEGYRAPAFLLGTPENIDRVLRDAAVLGEELSREQAETWLRQFCAIYRYVATSTDQFLNVRGGAGVGKTFALEMLVGESLAAGRNVFVTAPYGEQARVVMRSEAVRLAGSGSAAVAEVFRQANTVDHLLARARNAAFTPQLRGADIYVDEAGLLDAAKALALVRLAREHGARVVFQGDTAQMAAVGRGQPIKLLQERLGLGMSVERASVSRRQRKQEDKKLAVELSSGHADRFNRALEALIARGRVREVPEESLVNAAARKIVTARDARLDQLVVSSVHRLGEAVSDRLHELRLESDPQLASVRIATHRSKDLEPAERLSSQFYQAGDVVEYLSRAGASGPVQGRVESVVGNSLRVRCHGRLQTVTFDQVSDVFTRETIERTVGARFLLTGKIKAGKQVYENKSLQVLRAVEGNTLVFASGLRLHADDGRLAQGDVLTAYKAQGAKADSVLVVEDNRSLGAMASREAMHVLFTRHVETVEMLVESHAVLREAADRTQAKRSAVEFATSGQPSGPSTPADAKPPTTKDRISRSFAFALNRTRAVLRPVQVPVEEDKGTSAKRRKTGKAGVKVADWSQLWERFKKKAGFQLRKTGKEVSFVDLGKSAGQGQTDVFQIRVTGTEASITQLADALARNKTAPPPPQPEPERNRHLER